MGDSDRELDNLDDSNESDEGFSPSFAPTSGIRSQISIFQTYFEPQYSVSVKHTRFLKANGFFGSWLILLSLTKILKNHNFRVVFAYVFAKQNKPEIPKKVDSKKYSISIVSKNKIFSGAVAFFLNVLHQKQT